MENLSIYIYDSTQIRAKRDMTEKIYSIPQNAKLSTLFNNMFCHRLDLDCGVRQFKYQKLFFLLWQKCVFLVSYGIFCYLHEWKILKSPNLTDNDVMN